MLVMPCSMRAVSLLPQTSCAKASCWAGSDDPSDIRPEVAVVLPQITPDGPAASVSNACQNRTNLRTAEAAASGHEPRALQYWSTAHARDLRPRRLRPEKGRSRS